MRYAAGMNKTYHSNSYGDVEVLDGADRHAVRIRFVDSGYETTVRQHNLTAGKMVDHPVKAARTAARKRRYAAARNEIEKRERAENHVARRAPTPPADVAQGTMHWTKHRGQVCVLAYHSADRIDIIFVNTGYQTTTSAHALRRNAALQDPLAPTVFGVGRIGIGPHKAHEKTADTQPFKIWRAMLRRCYYVLPDGRRSHPSYAGVTVCAEWHDFQTFAQWYVESYPAGAAAGAYQLDKDIEVRGNTVYGPDACQFVTQRENLSARTWRASE